MRKSSLFLVASVILYFLLVSGCQDDGSEKLEIRGKVGFTVDGFVIKESENSKPIPAKDFGNFYEYRTSFSDAFYDKKPLKIKLKKKKNAAGIKCWWIQKIEIASE